MDGYEVCRRIRADPATAFLPVVMVTASGDAARRSARIEAGADDFITKPLNQAELLARVRSLVRVKRYHDTVARRRPSSPSWNQRARGARRRAGRRARAAGPAAPLPLAADRRARRRHRRRVVPAQPPPRDRRRCSPTCAASPRSPRAASRRRPWRCSAEYHLALGELVVRATRARSSTSPATGCSSSSTTRSPARTRRTARVRMAVEMRARVAELARGVAARRGTTSASGWASPRATPRSAGSASRAATTTPRSARVTNLAARLCADGRAGQILVSQRVRHGIVGPVDCREVGPPGPQGLQPAGGGVRGHRPARRKGCRDERPRRPNGPTLDELDEDGRNAVFDRLQAQMPEVWAAMRRDDARESVVVVPVDDPRPGRGERAAG